MRAAFYGVERHGENAHVQTYTCAQQVRASAMYHPSNQVFSISLHASLRLRVRGVRIKSCVGSGGAWKVPFCLCYLPVGPTLSHLQPALPQTAIGNGWENEISHSTKFFDEGQRTVLPERKRHRVDLINCNAQTKNASDYS